MLEVQLKMDKKTIICNCGVAFLGIEGETKCSECKDYDRETI